MSLLLGLILGAKYGCVSYSTLLTFSCFVFERLNSLQFWLMFRNLRLMRVICLSVRLKALRFTSCFKIYSCSIMRVSWFWWLIYSAYCRRMWSSRGFWPRCLGLKFKIAQQTLKRFLVISSDSPLNCPESVSIKRLSFCCLRSALNFIDYFMRVSSLIKCSWSKKSTR